MSFQIAAADLREKSKDAGANRDRMRSRAPASCLPPKRSVASPRALVRSLYSFEELQRSIVFARSRPVSLHCRVFGLKRRGCLPRHKPEQNVKLPAPPTEDKQHRKLTLTPAPPHCFISISHLARPMLSRGQSNTGSDKRPILKQ